MGSHRFKTFVEIVAVFAVFFLYGAWMVPDSNEAHYIGKALHFWNPDWIPDDPFLQSGDSHWTFYLVFGWIPLFVSLPTAAWIGRIVAWSLLAWSWQRLSFALIPIRWAAIPTALALAYYIESFHMAGEWLIGGIEGKSLAYPFVFFALEAMLRRRWNRVGIFLGVACAFHILVGGWATVIVGVIFFIDGRRQTADGSREVGIATAKKTAVCRLLSAVFIGGLLALCGLIPALMSDAGTSPEVVREAHRIYVFERLPHHLVPYTFKDSFQLRFALLTAIWILLCRHGGSRQRMFNAFVWGTLVLAAIGINFAHFFSENKEFAAAVLRFYWFRLSDIAVPMGVALGGTRVLVSLLGTQKSGGCSAAQSPDFPKMLAISAIITAIYVCFGFFKTTLDPNVPWAMTMLICVGLFYAFTGTKNRVSHGGAEARRKMGIALLLIAIVFYAPLTILPNYVNLRFYTGQCRTDTFGPNGKRAIEEWKDMCQWIKKNTEPTDKFWIPRDGHTFKWYAQRSDIGTWKNLPQDAESIVKWRKAMRDLYVYKNAEGKNAEDRLITTLLLSKTEEQIAAMQEQYNFAYILCAIADEMPSHSTLQLVYANDVYCLYYVSRP
jgi:hypothetical protein